MRLPSEAVCTSCHAEKRVIKVPKVRIIDRFNHQTHVKFGNIAPILRAAIASKKYLDTRIPTQLDTANSCADCLVCHNKIDPPFSCEKCHNNVAALKPVNHSHDFLDKHNRMKSALDKSNCASCHGRQFTCLGCH